MRITLPKLAVKVNELFFFIAYVLYLSVCILYISSYAVYIQGIYRPVFFACLGSLALKEIYGSKYNIKTFIGAVVVFGLLLFIKNSLSGVLQFGTSIMLIYCAKDITLKKILKVTVWLSSALFLFIVLSAYAGIIENYVYVQAATGSARIHMGFRYALYGPTVLFGIIACDIYLHKERISKWKLLFFSVVDYLCYTQTNSRLTFALTLFILFAVLALKYKPLVLKRRKKICFLVANSWRLCAGIFLWLIAMFRRGAEWAQHLNTLPGGRLLLGLSSLAAYGVSLFVNAGISWVGSGLDIYGSKSTAAYLHVDNLYLQLLQRVGIIFFAAFLIIFTVACFKYLKRKNYHMLLTLAVPALHGIIDDLIVYLYYDTFLLAAGTSPLETGRGTVSRRAKDAAGTARGALLTPEPGNRFTTGYCMPLRWEVA